MKRSKDKTKSLSKGDELMKKYHNSKSFAEDFIDQVQELQRAMLSPLNVTKLLKSNEQNTPRRSNRSL